MGNDSGQQGLPYGTQIGFYRLESNIGEGGMGTVYRALDAKLNRAVAIKFLSDDFADVSARRRFQREAQMASSLNHPHILTVLDAGEFKGRQYLVTEYVDGGTLKDWVQSQHGDWRSAIELLTGVADGLAAAHEAGILHRDIKPANILITRTGYAKLADFGLAKLAQQPIPGDESTRTMTDEVTRKGAVVGTIAYMSPEQASGKPLDARSDVFSFGVVLYLTLTGRRPFEGQTDLETLQKIIHAAPEPLPESVPASIRALVERAMEKDPAHRYQFMRDMVVDLRRVVRQSVAPSAAPIAAPSRTPASRLKWAIVIGVPVLLVVAIGFMASRLKAPLALNPIQYTQLTNVDSAIDPALSPDGRMLAFVRGLGTAVQSTGDPTEIYVKPLPDGDPVQLTHDRVPYKKCPRFSPDGTRIAYMTLETSGFNTYVVPVLGGEGPRRLLTNGEGMNWINERTADGSRRPRILFSYMTGKGVTMAIASATEGRSDERTIFVKDGYMEHFSYLSPDGKQLLLAEMVPGGSYGPCRLAPYDASSEGRTVGPNPSQCHYADWSPDGKWMYFSAHTDGYHIWRQRFPDGMPEQITFSTAEEEGVFIAPDGRSLVSSIGTFQNKIWVHDARGDRQITAEAYSFLPTFSADGKKLYYIVRTGGGVQESYGQLWVTDLESGQWQRLLPEFQMWQYSISRTASVPYLQPRETHSGQGVWLANLDGSAAPRQFTSQHAFTAFFGPGDDLLYSAAEKALAAVYRVKADGTNLRKVIPEATHHLNAVSPDGKYFAVSLPVSTQESGGSGVTVVYPIDGGPSTTVCICGNRNLDAPQPVTWSADGKLLYLSLVGGQKVYAIPLRPGQILPPLPREGIRSPEDAAQLPGAMLLPAAGEFPGPNPSLYAFPKFTSQRNIYRIPLQ